MQDIGRKMARGAAWMMSVQVSARVLGLINTMILARLLLPEDFGLVAVAVSVLGLLEIMGAFNFDLALIQNQQAERRHYDTAWTLNILYGLFTAVIMAALAIPVARFFGDPRVEGVMYVFAASPLVSSFKNIGTVAFQKELNFGREVVFVLVGKVVSVVVTATLAYVYRSYWALAIGSLCSACIGVILSYLMHPFRPRFALTAWRELMRFSGWMLFSNILIYVGNRGYDFVIGRIAGTQALGLYTVSHEIANLPTTEIVWPATKAIFPGFSKMANDRGRLKEVFLRIAALVAMITIPAGAGVAVLAEPIVRLVLGVKWLDAVPLIQILAVFGVLRALHAGSGAVYLALGKTHIMAWVAMPNVIIGLPLAMFLLENHGLQGAAFAVVTGGAIALTMGLAIAMRILDLGLAELGGCFWRPLLAAGVMVVVVHQLKAWAGGIAETPALVGYTLLMVGTGAVVYAVAIVALWLSAGRPSGAESTVAGRLKAFARSGKTDPAA